MNKDVPAMTRRSTAPPERGVICLGASIPGNNLDGRKKYPFNFRGKHVIIDLPDYHGPVAQRIEQWFPKPCVGSSTLSGAAMIEKHKAGCQHSGLIWYVTEAARP